jgi:hypothetical protein
VPGELIDIGHRPKLVASFAPPGGVRRFNEWRARNAELLADIPAEAIRYEYGRAAAGGTFVRVRVDEESIPPGLEGPDELGAAAGLPPMPPAA